VAGPGPHRRQELGRSAGGARARKVREDSGDERTHANLRRHEPDQAPGERFLERPAREGLFLRGEQENHPARMIDRPVAGAASRGDRSSKCVLQLANGQSWIDAGSGDSASEITRENRAIS